MLILYPHVIVIIIINQARSLYWFILFSFNLEMAVPNKYIMANHNVLYPAFKMKGSPFPIKIGSIDVTIKINIRWKYKALFSVFCKYLLRTH